MRTTGKYVQGNQKKKLLYQCNTNINSQSEGNSYEYIRNFHNLRIIHLVYMAVYTIQQYAYMKIAYLRVSHYVLYNHLVKSHETNVFLKIQPKIGSGKLIMFMFFQLSCAKTVRARKPIFCSDKCLPPKASRFFIDILCFHSIFDTKPSFFAQLGTRVIIRIHD